mmetsp:Transcript_11428/g.27279  ORF Transcript_11428/g.27279 Transcript_11428/m.27279 type:complete len:879 (+) Transcript_11428:212-2848(+)
MSEKQVSQEEAMSATATKAGVNPQSQAQSQNQQSRQATPPSTSTGNTESHSVATQQHDLTEPSRPVRATVHPLSANSKSETGPSKVDETEIDKLAEDLVLVEGDGHVHRPKPLKLKRAASNNTNPNKKPPATSTVTSTTTTTNLSRLSSQAKRLMKEGSSASAASSRGTGGGGGRGQQGGDGIVKSGMEDFFDRVRRTSSGLVGGGVDESDNSEDYDETDLDDPTSSSTTQPNKSSNKRNSSMASGIALTSEDIEICQRLDEEYERALEEREIGYNARYASVRQSAFVSVLFLLVYMVQGTLVYMHQTEWSIPDSLFFSIFTITTVGYGKEDLPTTPEFQAYTIFYIMVGIAALTIMVAQVYQCIALEASRAQHSRDVSEMKQRGLDVLATQPQSPTNASTHSGVLSISSEEIVSNQRTNIPSAVDMFFRLIDKARTFFRDTELGRGISVTFPFAGLILAGALVVGPMEGWTFIESLYFAVVSLTTVGFGDYVPTELPSIIFCIFWLPFSVGFMSMYLGNIAAFYIRLSDRNIRRIERQLRRRLHRAKQRAERERAEVLRRAYRGQEEEIEAIAAASDDGDEEEGKESVSTIASSADAGAGVHHVIPLHHAKRLAQRRNKDKKDFDMLPTSDMGAGSDDETNLFGSSDADAGNLRRQRIINNSREGPSSDQGSDSAGTRTMKSMKDVISAVRRRNKIGASGTGSSSLGSSSQFMSIRSTQTMTQNSMFRSVQTRKPSFALRVLLQERFAEIIADEIAGYQSSIEIKANTLSVTIDSVEETADKWSIPRRARKAFRSVAFEVLYFVGEHGLVTKGAGALFELTPFEFHGLFSSLVAAMGDADSMEQWLESTDTLALVDLQRSQGDLSSPGPAHQLRQIT